MTLSIANTRPQLCHQLWTLLPSIFGRGQLFLLRFFPELRIRRNVLRRQFSASKDLHEVTKRECTQKSIAAGSDFKVHAVAVTQESDPVC